MKSPLRDAQLRQFNETGYLVLPSLFSEQEIRQMRTEADYILELIINSSLANCRRSRRLSWLKQPNGVQSVRKIQPINDRSLYLSEISNDSRHRRGNDLGKWRQLNAGY